MNEDLEIIEKIIREIRKAVAIIIFDIVPKSVVARDLGINNMRFSKLINQPALFSFKDTFNFAALLEVDDMVLISLIYNQIQANKKSKK